MFDQVGRYGGAARFDPLSKGKVVGGVKVTKAGGVEIRGTAFWTPKHLDDLDGFVFKVRSQLDFVKIKWGDHFQQLLARPDADPWKGVLTKGNRYFKAPAPPSA